MSSVPPTGHHYRNNVYHHPAAVIIPAKLSTVGHLVRCVAPCLRAGADRNLTFVFLHFAISFLTPIKFKQTTLLIHYLCVGGGGVVSVNIMPHRIPLPQHTGCNSRLIKYSLKHEPRYRLLGCIYLHPSRSAMPSMLRYHQRHRGPGTGGFFPSAASFSIQPDRPIFFMVNPVLSARIRAV